MLDTAERAGMVPTLMTVTVKVPLLSVASWIKGEWKGIYLTKILRRSIRYWYKTPLAPPPWENSILYVTLEKRRPAPDHNRTTQRQCSRVLRGQCLKAAKVDRAQVWLTERNVFQVKHSARYRFAHAPRQSFPHITAHCSSKHFFFLLVWAFPITVILITDLYFHHKSGLSVF